MSALLLLLLAPGQDAPPPPGNNLIQWIRATAVGKVAPDLTGQDLQGQAISLKTFRGKPVVVDVWSMSCPPCLCFAPELSLAQKEGEFQLLGINVDRDAMKVARTMKLVEMTWPVAFDKSGRLTNAKLSMPLYIVLDAQHIVRYRGNDHRNAIRVANTNTRTK